MIVFEGVNDLGMQFRPPTPGAPAMPLPSRQISADDIIAGYRQIVARAHAHGVKVYGATIAPYKGASYWSPAGEAARQKINAFIRTGGLFDAVLDFDRAFQDPNDPARHAPPISTWAITCTATMRRTARWRSRSI